MSVEMDEEERRREHNNNYGTDAQVFFGGQRQKALGVQVQGQSRPRPGKDPPTSLHHFTPLLPIDS